MKTSQLITAGPAIRKTILLTSYMHASATHSPAKAEAQADEVVQRYANRWSSGVLEHLQREMSPEVFGLA
jgi:hypothetical protein